MVVLAACGAAVPTGPTAAPGTVQRAEVEDLRFGPGIGGAMTATTSESCTGAYVDRLHTLDATIVGPIGDATYGVYLRIRYVGGDSTYHLGGTGGVPADPRGATLQVGRQLNSPTPSWDAQSGTVTVDADGLGGRVDATLVSSDPGHATTAMTGRWRCSAPAPTKAAPPRQGLVFSGAVSGGFAGPHRAEAAWFAAATCSVSGGVFFFQLIGSPDDLPRILSITVVGYRGPGTYREKVDGATVSVELIPGYGEADTRGWALPEPAVVTVVVDRGERSGSVDARLVPAGAGGDVRVGGRWACG